MGLLDPPTRTELEELLLKLPNISNPLTLGLLIQDLPPGLQGSIPLGGTATDNVRGMVMRLEEDSAQLVDLSWPILHVIRRAVELTYPNTLLRSKLEKLRDKVGPAPRRAGVREGDETRGARAPVIAVARGPREPPAEFTGCERVLSELVRALAPGNTVRIVALHGKGGAGKTALALKLARAVEEQYPDGVIDLEELQPAGAPLPPEALMAAVIRFFLPGTHLPDSRDVLRAVFRSAVQGRRALLLLDNAANGEQVIPLVELGGGWGVIVTSRWNFLRSRRARAQEVDGLGADDAQLLLRRLLRDEEASDAELTMLAGACGRHPLTLRLVAGLVRASQSPVSELVAVIERDRLRYRVGEEQRESSVRVLEMSIARCQAENPELAALWALLGVFPAPFDDGAAAAVWDMDPEAVSGLLGALVHRGLLAHEPSTGRYWLHDILWDYAREMGAAGQESAQRRHAQHYLRIGEAAEEAFLVGGETAAAGLASFARALPHLLVAWDRLREAEDVEAREWLMQMPLGVASVLSLWVSPKQRISLLQAALTTARAGGDRYREGLAGGHLGQAFADLGDMPRAIEFFVQQLEIAREIPDSQAEADASWRLGLAYEAQGELERAAEFMSDCVALEGELGHPDAESHAARVEELRGYILRARSRDSGTGEGE